MKFLVFNPTALVWASTRNIWSFLFSVQPRLSELVPQTFGEPTSHGVSSKTTLNSSKSWSTQDELPWSLSGVLSPTVSVSFSLKNAQKVILFGDPENRSFTSETMKVRDPQEIVTKTRSFLYLWNDQMSHVRLLLDKTRCFSARTHAGRCPKKGAAPSHKDP